MTLETTTKYRVNTEDEAKNMIEKFREQAKTDGILLKKAGYEYKTKKSKGEIVDEGYLISATFIYNDFWSE
jgi:hypothetical protein